MLRAYFNEKAVGWDETVAERDMTKLERMAKSLDIQPGSALLDVGTGTGVFVPYLLREVGRCGRLVTLDFALEMLQIARAKSFAGNVEYLHADIHHIPLGDEVFDTVVCYSSFPHFQDKPGSLGEINRVLKRGGKLFICHTSCRTHINGIHRQLPAVQNDVIPDKDEMRTILLATGFSDIAIYDNGDSYLASASKADIA